MSRFMIGTGSDGEHEPGERSPKHEEMLRVNGGEQDRISPEPEKIVEASDWSDCEEASVALTKNRAESKCQDEEPEASIWSDEGGDSIKLNENQTPTSLDKRENDHQVTKSDPESPIWTDEGEDSFKLNVNQAPTSLDKRENEHEVTNKNDPESPVWSDDDLQSWGSNKNQNIVSIPENANPDQKPLCQKDSDCKENAKFRKINTSAENLLGKSKSHSEEMSDDSYKPIPSMANVPSMSQTIPKYTSPEQSEFPKPLPRSSKTDNKSRRKITLAHKSNIDQRIERLRRKVDDLEASASEALTESDYTDVEMSDSEFSDTSDLEKYLATPTKRSGKLKTYVQIERLKRENLKKIVGKLKEQKKNQREYIDDLITRNKVLEKDVTDNQSSLNQSHIKCTLAEENFKSAKCLKGNLMDEIDTQSSMLLDKMNEVNQLKIKLKENQIENGFLHETIENYSHQHNANSEDILRLKLDEEISHKQIEFDNKIIELEQAYLEKEKLWKEDHLKELQCKEKDYNSQIERLMDEHKSVLSNMESAVTSNLSDFKSEREKNDSLVSNLTLLETENSALKEKLDEYLTKNKSLESNLEKKTQEISDLQEQTKNLETVDSLKAQFSHMADTYEKKIERLEQDIETNAEKLGQETNSYLEQLRDKDELINHLKKDLGLIRQDYEERMKLREIQLVSEKETLSNRVDLMEKSKLNYVKEIERLKKELEDQSLQIKEGNRISEKLEGKSREYEDMGKELLLMKEEAKALVNENKDLKANIQHLKQEVEEEKINKRLVYCAVL